ncbi:MAG: hypothetical protein IKX20_09190 [Paludibacteraceae bacterium]|nr:hypothetical protein [Paludibacteraceae bacterium]
MEHDCYIYAWNSACTVEGVDIVMVWNTLLNIPNCCLNCAERFHLCRLVEGGLGFDAAGDLQKVSREGTDGDWNHYSLNNALYLYFQALAVPG